MATDFSRLFIAPKWDRPETPQVDFYRMLGGIGDSLIAAEERARQRILRELIGQGLPRRADNSIDHEAATDMAARSGYLPSIKDFATLGERARLSALRFARAD
jgi:hypothetical protein